MSMMRALALLGSGAKGYEEGVDLKRKREADDRRAANDEEDRKWQREQRERQRQEWGEKDADRAAERAAMAPVEATPELAPDQQGPQAFNVGGRVVADPAAAEAAAAAANAPAARMGRAAAAVRDPGRAMQLEGAAQQSRLTEAQLREVDGQQKAKAWDRMMGDALIGSPQALSDPAAAAKWMTESQADGKGGKTAWRAKVDGATLNLFPVDEKGEPIGDGFKIPNTLDGRVQLAAMLSKATPISEKLKDIRAREDGARKAGHDAEVLKLRQQEVNQQGEYQRGMVAAAQTRADGAGRSGGGSGEDAPPPVWDDKADAFLRQRFTVNDPTTGAVTVDGQGLQFGKALALSVSRKNGGDTTQAIGYAFDVDNRLRAAATDAKGNYDPAKHRTLRTEALAAMSKPAQATDTDSKMAAVKADMQRSGVQSANFNLNGVQGTIGAPAAARPPAPAAPAAPSPAAQPTLTGDAVLNRVMAESAGEQQKRMAALAPAVEQLQALKAQLVAVARSGDKRAIALAGEKVMQARTAIAQAAKATLGPDADAFIAKL